MAKGNGKLNRRDLLKMFGAASGLAFPILNSQILMAQNVRRAPVRVLFVPIGHGWGVDDEYEPFRGDGTDFEIPSIWSPLEPLRDRCLFIDGIRGAQWGNAHNMSVSDHFTASVPAEETRSSQLGGNPEPMGESIDHYLGRMLNTQVLRIGAHASGNMCFNQRAQVLPFYERPQEVYNSVIKPLIDAANSNQPVPIPVDTSFEQSLLSFLGTDANRLMDRLPSSQTRKVESYIEGLDALRQSASQPPTPAGQMDPLSAVPGNGLSDNAETDYAFEFVKLAFQAGTHNVAMISISGNPNRIDNFRWVDGQGRNRSDQVWSDYHQDGAHYNRNKQHSREIYTGVVKHYLRKITDFANTLERIQDVDGRTMLDNTMIILSSRIGNGQHARRRMANVIIGGGGGNIRTGRLLNIGRIPHSKLGGSGVLYQRRNGQVVDLVKNYGSDWGNRTQADLWTAVARATGLNTSSFGLPAVNHEPLPL